jgi:sulfonate dioxygenase
MAPSFEEPVFAPPSQTVVHEKQSFIVKASKLDYEPGRSAVENHDNYEHEDLRPQFPNVRWPALTKVPYDDKGLKGDPKFRNLLAHATNAFDYTPKVGTEIHGVNLAHLTDAQKNDLARLIATRGVVFFRGQEDFDIDAQRELGKYFGTLHKVRHILHCHTSFH